MVLTMRRVRGILLASFLLVLLFIPKSAVALPVPFEVSVEVSVTGRPASPEILVEALLWEIRRALGLPLLAEPRLLVLSNAPPLSPGEEVEVTGVVQFAGMEQRMGEVVFRALVRNEATDLRTAEILVVSNSPERIQRHGVLLPEVTLSGPVRVLFHHKNETAAPLDLLVKVRSMGPEGSRVHLVGGMGKAGRDELRAGHQAMRAYLAKFVQGMGYWVSVPPGGEVSIAAQRLHPGHVASGVLHLQISGDPVRLWVEAVEDGDPVPLEEDGVHFRGVVKDPTVVAQGAYLIGSPPFTLWVGGPPFLQEEATKRSLRGNYGVVYEILVTLANPMDRDGTVALIFVPHGGPAGGVLVIDGQIFEIGPTPAFSEVPVATFTLAPREQRAVVLRISPQAGSWYPVRLEFRAIPGWESSICYSQGPVSAGR